MKRSTICVALFSVVGIAACTAEATDDDAVAESTGSELVVGAPGSNISVTGDELADPGTGCFVTNPTCSLNAGLALAQATREDWIRDSARCTQRAAEWSGWCGNLQGASTRASFRLHNRQVANTVFTASNDTRCVISLGFCNRSPNSKGVFGDTFEGADTDATRCAGRAKDFFDWCGNPLPAKVGARFDRGGAAGDTVLWPR